MPRSNNLRNQPRTAAHGDRAPRRAPGDQGRPKQPRQVHARLGILRYSPTIPHELGVAEMHSWTTLGWVVFALSLIWAVSTNIVLRQHYSSSVEPMLPANATALTQLASVVV